MIEQIFELFWYIFLIFVVFWPIVIVGFLIWKSKKQKSKYLWKHILVLGILQAGWIYFLLYQIGKAFKGGFF